jgi:RNA polymerase sigma-70 factor (ECF subfamily)
MFSQIHNPEPRTSPFPLVPAADLVLLSDEDLMAAYALGDERAFRVLFERHAPALRRAVRRRVDSEDDARDIVQQTLLNVHRARDAFDPQRKLRPWLFAIAMNMVREHHRRAGRRREYPLEAHHLQTSFEPPRVAQQLQAADSLRVAMEALLDNQREVIELRWWQDRSYEEISDMVGASVSAVRVRAHRGYQRLRGALEAQA